MATPLRRQSQPAESSSDDDADVLARARLLPSSPQKPAAAASRRATAISRPQMVAVAPNAAGASSDSDAELVRRALQKPAQPQPQVIWNFLYTYL